MTAGNMTPGEVRAFQLRNGNHLGRPLAADGIVGPETAWALAFVTLDPERRRVVREAQQWLGLAEEPPGSNTDRGGVITAWLQRSGAKPGDPWCAAAVSRWLGTVMIAGAQRLGKHFPATALPLPGDVFWYPTTGGRGHCGIVTGVSTLEVMTIEGNLRHAVRSVRRPRAGLFFSRAIANTDGQCPGVVERLPLELGAGSTR